MYTFIRTEFPLAIRVILVLGGCRHQCHSAAICTVCSKHYIGVHVLEQEARPRSVYEAVLATLFPYYQ